MKKKVLLAMSGGVDSSVSAHILQKAGYEITGITMITHSRFDTKSISDAENVAKKLGFQHHTIDLQKEFNKKIITYFKEQYKSGKTPNPCVVCNQFIKFGILFDLLGKFNADYFATGHYAKISYNTEQKEYELLKASDLTKDQSYFLFNLNQNILSKTIFPLGNLMKSEVREIAKKLNLKIHDKKESQDICFINESISEYLKDDLEDYNFTVIDSEGKALGRTKKTKLFTIGQRKGVEIAYSEPLFVNNIDMKKKIITVGTRNQLYKREFNVKSVHFISDKLQKNYINQKLNNFTATVKIRYRFKEASAQIKQIDNDLLHIKFDKPQLFITPGQFAVFHEKEIILGGGEIV